MDETPRQMRLSSRVRGVIITALIAAYGWLFDLPRESFAEVLLIAAALQAAVILMRRWIPAAGHAATLYVLEMIADGVTVLLFALGVFGGLQGMAAAI